MKKHLLLKKYLLQISLLCAMLFGWSASALGFTVYFDNTNTQWSKVYIYFYDGPYWGEKGSGSKNDKSTKVGPQEMSFVEGNIYAYSNPDNYTVVAFTKDKQSNYGNFWQTEAAYSDGTDFNVTGQCSSDTPLFIAGTEKTTLNENVPYYSGEWAAYTPTPILHTITVGGYADNTKVPDFTLTTLDYETYTGSVTLSDQYKFKVDIDGTKYSDDSHFKETATKTLKTGKGKNYIDITTPGQYDFEFVYTTKALTVTYPGTPTDGSKPNAGEQSEVSYKQLIYNKIFIVNGDEYKDFNGRTVPVTNEIY